MNVAIIAAAGRGERMGGGRAKQFREISGTPIIIHTLRRFEHCASIAEVVGVVPAGGEGELLALAEAHGLRKLQRVVSGGETRTASIRRGLQSVAASAAVVAVHDAVRPFVTPEEIDRVVGEAARHGAAILALRAVDTIKEADGGRVARTLERERLWHAQTPQCFAYGLLRRAHERAEALGLEATDDSALVESLGEPVRLVEGHARNIKITTRQDFALAEILVSSPEFRVPS
jgi:2-C-methyl-D-erythritol 4-phosphate cytidylyltransferase